MPLNIFPFKLLIFNSLYVAQRWWNWFYFQFLLARRQSFPQMLPWTLKGLAVIRLFPVLFLKSGPMINTVGPWGQNGEEVWGKNSFLPKNSLFSWKFPGFVLLDHSPTWKLSQLVLLHSWIIVAAYGFLAGNLLFKMQFATSGTRCGQCLTYFLLSGTRRVRLL